MEYLDRIRGSLSNKLKDHIICMTGRMWASRSDIEELITKHGGIVTKNVSNKNTLIITGPELDSNNNKIKKARGYNIKELPSDSLKSLIMV